MHLTYVVTTILAALANGYAAALNFAGAESVKVIADRVRVSRRWMVPLGTVLASGAVGLLTGFAVPALGTAAARSKKNTAPPIWRSRTRRWTVTAHMKYTTRPIAAAALTTNVAYHHA